MNANERNRIMVTMTAVFAVIGVTAFLLTIRKDSNTKVAPPTTSASAETTSVDTSSTSTLEPPTAAPTTSSRVVSNTATSSPALSTIYPRPPSVTSTAPKTTVPVLSVITLPATFPVDSQVVSNTDTQTTPGISLEIPTTDSASSPALHKYTVVYNDSPILIALKCRPNPVKVEIIVEANKWPEGIAHHLYPGNKVLVPCQTMLLKTDGTTETTTLASGLKHLNRND